MKIICTQDAPEAIGPYSQAIDTGEFVFMSGQIPLDPATMQIKGCDIEEQTEQVFRNIKAVLQAAGLKLDNIVKTTVYLAEMNDFIAMNAVYEKAFGSHKPARSAIEAARLPKNALVEIECIAKRFKDGS